MARLADNVALYSVRQNHELPVTGCYELVESIRRPTVDCAGVEKGDPREREIQT
jgi:hypothetical protein